jgi:exodeoxyribonuclease VII large subunit
VRPEPVVHGDRKVYTVSAFNRGVASWLERLPTVWVEGEVTELRRQPGWQSVFFTLKDQRDGSCLAVSMPRGGFDALRLELADGATVHVFGRPELFEARGTFRLRALTIEPLGLGALLAGIERLKRKLTAEGLFAAERKRPLPIFPRRVALLTGADAAAKRDFLTAVAARFPAARVVVAETAVQGPRAAPAIVAGLRALSAEEEVDVVVLARGGGSFEDLLPFSDERVVRAVATCPVPVVSAVGHEQDTPLCDLAADARASTPTAAARLVVPDEGELRERLEGLRASLAREAGRTVARGRDRLALLHTALAREAARTVARSRERVEADGVRLARAPAALVERKRAEVEALAGRLRALSPRSTLARGYAIVRAGDGIVRDAAALAPGERVGVDLARGSFGARVEDVAP